MTDPGRASQLHGLLRVAPRALRGVAVARSTEARLEATQMRLDLSLPVSVPARVHLRPMPADEFAGYRDHLVTAYAQDMVDAGACTDLTTALEASERYAATERTYRITL